MNVNVPRLMVLKVLSQATRVLPQILIPRAPSCATDCSEPEPKFKPKLLLHDDHEHRCQASRPPTSLHSTRALAHNDTFSECDQDDADYNSHHSNT